MSCSTKPYVVESGDGQTDDSTAVKLYIVNHGWHTGIITPAREILQHIPLLNRRFKDAPYLEFGWGDQGFYQADEITSSLILQAILWPTKSVVHVVALRDEVNSYFSNVRSVTVSQKGFLALTTFLVGSFEKDSSGNIQSLSKGIYGDSQFYRGSGSYHAFNTCNTWTAKGLKSAGFDISPSLKLSAQSIMNYLEKYELRITN